MREYITGRDEWITQLARKPKTNRGSPKGLVGNRPPSFSERVNPWSWTSWRSISGRPPGWTYPGRRSSGPCWTHSSRNYRRRISPGRRTGWRSSSETSMTRDYTPGGGTLRGALGLIALLTWPIWGRPRY